MSIIEDIAYCIEFGKADINCPYPLNMKGKEGANELTKRALEQGIQPKEILNQGMISAMEKVGGKFSENQIFVPQMLISANAMAKAMQHLKSYFADGSVKRKGVFVIGTVFGDLHDIGKNLVAMIVEGNGWEVIDLGVNVTSDVFIEKIKEHPKCKVGLSALLTTTMANMEQVARDIKTASPETPILIGGAPINQEFCDKIGADYYSSDPQDAIHYLDMQQT